MDWFGAYAGSFSVSVKSDLTQIRFFNQCLVMQEGIAWFAEEGENICGFFTPDALERIQEEKDLKLERIGDSNFDHPSGLEEGLFFAIWEKKSKEGSSTSVIFNILSIQMPDEEGNFWHEGEIISEE